MRLPKAPTATLIVLLMVVWSTISAFPAGADDPRPPTQSCENNGLSLAPVTQKTERFDHIVPKPDGRFVPVIMVHGLSSSSDVFTGNINLTAAPGQSANVGRNLITQIQDIPGTAVYLFDYRQYANRWVVDSHIAPALGDAIDCLYQTTGEKVIVVAHSMGGLTARTALRNPSSRADKVSTLITFGTPVRGSVLASISNGAIDGVPLGEGSLDLNLLKFIMEDCGTLKTADPTADCAGVPDLTESIKTDAGRSMTYKNSDLDGLDDVPSSVNTVALAGDIVLRLGNQRVNIIGNSVSTPGPWGQEHSLGDFVVSTDSAVAGSDRQKTVTCTYQASPTEMLLNTGLEWIQQQEVGAEGVVGNLFDGACYHNNLMRSIELTNEAIGTIDDELVSRGGGSAQGSAATPSAGSLFQNTKIQCQTGSRLVVVAKTEHGEAGQCINTASRDEFRGYLTAYSSEYRNGEQQMVLYRGDLPLVDGALNATSEGYDLTVGPKRVTYVDLYGDKVIDDPIVQIASEDGVENIEQSATVTTAVVQSEALDPTSACTPISLDRVNDVMMTNNAGYDAAGSGTGVCTIFAGDWRIQYQRTMGEIKSPGDAMGGNRRRIEVSIGRSVQFVDAPSLSDNAFVVRNSQMGDSPEGITARWVREDVTMSLVAYWNGSGSLPNLDPYQSGVVSIGEGINSALGG